MDAICIWCRGTTSGAPREHIVPEALWPDGPTLAKGEVCARCNHGVLARLDLALVASLDIVRFFGAVPTKRGTPPSVVTRSNLAADMKDGAPAFYVNMGPGDVRLPSGRVLKAPRNDSSSIDVTMIIHDGEGPGAETNMHARGQMLHHPDCARALHKVALEMICRTQGQATALGPTLDPVRQFVTRGEGRRWVLCVMPGDIWRYHNEIGEVYRSTQGWTVPFTIGNVRFIVDCTPDQRHLPRLRGALLATRGFDGWTHVPPLSAASS